MPAPRCSPYEGFQLSYTLEYDHPVFAAHAHTATVEFSSTSFVKEVSRARTFGFLADFEKLRDLNLAQGGSLDNAVVVDDSKILNEHGLRARDEFVKHKILDAIGDLYLLGYSMLGGFHGHKSGHGLNNQLVRKLLSEPDSYEIVTFDQGDQVPESYARKSTEAGFSALSYNGLALIVSACHFEDKLLNTGKRGECAEFFGIKSGAMKRIFVATPALRQLMIKREP